MNSKRWLCLAVMSCLVLLSSASLFGQATANASLQGTITDKTQAVISKAEVTLTNKETGATKPPPQMTRADIGSSHCQRACIRLRPPLQDFPPQRQRNVELLVEEPRRKTLAFRLAESVKRWKLPALRRWWTRPRPTLAPTSRRNRSPNLPLIGRDIADLAYLAPGVKAADSYDPTKNRYAILSVNGEGGRNVNVTVNGIDNKDNTVGGPVMQLPAEAVQEFQVSTQRFSAVNGRSEGAAINVITKSGSNNYHGSAFGSSVNRHLTLTRQSPMAARHDFNRQSSLLTAVVWRVHWRADQERQAVRLLRL